ncbi:MAG: c-type cytochrome [candidate division KSB1 bacterium]|jgi:cytochrome c551/c552|nr:c-type cytochrome [candidate division KSB1 bacterium]
MQLFDQFTMLLSPEHLFLVKILLGLMLVLHLPYIAMLFGSSLFSVIFRVLGKDRSDSDYMRFSRDLINTFASNVGVALLLGILPLLVIALLYSQLLFEANATTLSYMMISFLPIVAGIILIYVYRSLSTRTGLLVTLTGFLGVLILLAGYILLIASIVRFHDPEKWGFIRNPAHLLLGWNAIAGTNTYLTLSLTTAASGILFFFFKWTEKLKGESKTYRDYVRNFSTIIGLLFAVTTPVFFIWHLITLTDISYSMEFLGLAILFIVIMGVIVYYFSKMLEDSNVKAATRTFILMLIAFAVLIVSNHVAMENALKEHTASLLTKSETMLAELLPEREMEEGGGLMDFAKGEDVFKSICASCHRFDKKIVGPPYATVLDKYEDDIESLVSFIRNPQKVNPEYPPMANLGLKIAEAEAVAGYLIKTYQEEYK